MITRQAGPTSKNNAEPGNDSDADDASPAWTFTLMPEDDAPGISGRRRPPKAIRDVPAANLQLLRINDVCQLLRISKPTLWRMRRAHMFPEPTDVTGRVIAWRKAELQAWLIARQRSA